MKQSLVLIRWEWISRYFRCSSLKMSEQFMPMESCREEISSIKKPNGSIVHSVLLFHRAFRYAAVHTLYRPASQTAHASTCRVRQGRWEWRWVSYCTASGSVVARHVIMTQRVHGFIEQMWRDFPERLRKRPSSVRHSSTPPPSAHRRGWLKTWRLMKDWVPVNSLQWKRDSVNLLEPAI